MTLRYGIMNAFDILPCIAIKWHRWNGSTRFDIWLSWLTFYCATYNYKKTITIKKSLLKTQHHDKLHSIR